MSFITRQPNGLLCRFSTVVDCPTHWNMTEEEYIEMCAEIAREEAREVLKNNLKSFDELKRCFLPNNMTRKEFKNILKQMQSTQQIESLTRKKTKL